MLGVLVAWAAGNLFGLGPTSVAVALLVGFAAGSLPWLSGQGTAVAATAVVVLTTGFATNDTMLVHRLADTAIGIVTGLLVNLSSGRRCGRAPRSPR